MKKNSLLQKVDDLILEELEQVEAGYQEMPLKELVSIRSALSRDKTTYEGILLLLSSQYEFLLHEYPKIHPEHDMSVITKFLNCFRKYITEQLAKDETTYKTAQRLMEGK